MELKYPYLLLLFLIYIPIIAWYIWKYKGDNPSMGVSSTSMLDKIPITWKVYAIHLCFILSLITIGALIVALCRPQRHEGLTSKQIEGTDIVMAIDVSTSMLTEDIKPNRFKAAKQVASDFVSERENDNIGVVVFAGESLTLLPLTTDKAQQIQTIGNIAIGQLIDGTAIGNGLSSAINRVLAGKAKSKSIILLTDGTNNAGDVPPNVAAEIAKSKGIRIYTIGVGEDGSVTVPDPYGFGNTVLETKIDEASLKEIANSSGGKYFRAKNKTTLENVFKEIDSLEKSRFEVSTYRRTEENFMPWLLVALCAFSLQMLLRYLFLRRIP